MCNAEALTKSSRVRANKMLFRIPWIERPLVPTHCKDVTRRFGDENWATRSKEPILILYSTEAVATNTFKLLSFSFCSAICRRFLLLLPWWEQTPSSLSLSESANAIRSDNRLGFTKTPVVSCLFTKVTGLSLSSSHTSLLIKALGVRLRAWHYQAHLYFSSESRTYNNAVNIGVFTVVIFFQMVNQQLFLGR